MACRQLLTRTCNSLIAEAVARYYDNYCQELVPRYLDGWKHSYDASQKMNIMLMEKVSLELR